MARLPWHHSRSRTKSGNEKTYLSSSQDLFSRHTAEPSRQALADLVKVHKREKSDDVDGPRTRSRGSTITSLEWQRSRSRTGSGSDDAGSRPYSPHHTREGSVYSTWDRSEGATRALLAKGGMMLKRTGSKMSLSSAGSSSTLGLASPPRGSNVSAMNAPIRGEELRNKISAPFDFQHVTHTEETQFAGLNRIEEAELVNQFTDVVTCQSAAPGLRGIEVSDIGTTAGCYHALTADISSNELNPPLPQLSSTTTRPTPPPKDEVAEDCIVSGASAGKPTATSRCWGPRSPGFSPKGVLAAVDLALARADQSTPPRSARGQTRVAANDGDLNAKPLPDLPITPTEVPIIHAVTTEDNTARAMIAAPLPTPPVGISPALEGAYASGEPLHQGQKSSLGLPRHMSLYPSTKASMPNLLSVDRLSATPKALSRHHSDVALSQQARIAPAPLRSCDSRMSFAAIDTMDWEDAVDEAWDDVNEANDSAMDTSFSSFNSAFSVNVDEAISAASTPLMMAPSRPLPALPSQRASPSNGVKSHQLGSVQEDEQQTELSGLGICSCPPAAPAALLPNFSRSSSTSLLRRRSSMCYGSNESLTRSSSQESIILSIASSFIETQRSSKSSVCAEDLLTLSKAQRQPIPVSSVPGQDGQTLEETTSKKARPESGCLPSDILEQLTKVSATLSSQEAAEAQDTVPPVPPMPQHKYSKLSPKVAVPERRSSVTASGRNRSNTTGARPRQSARISYSLFPTAMPTPPVSS
ncbi:hypothetical protein LTR70_002588 [Exophiala xenobiotica]|nr:hypothetical protein LTR70_002588 [Exophiala xenobiotica]